MERENLTQIQENIYQKVKENRMHIFIMTRIGFMHFMVVCVFLFNGSHILFIIFPMMGMGDIFMDKIGHFLVNSLVLVIIILRNP